MEEMDQDSFYFFSKSNLLSRTNFTQRRNSAPTISSTERDFWCQVDTDLIKKLDEPSAYLTDFQMFEYSVAEYLQNLGIVDSQP